jgi:hypothetical protein
MRADHHLEVGDIIAAIQRGALSRAESRSVRLQAEPYAKASELLASALDPRAIADYERYQENSRKKLKVELQNLHEQAVAESGESRRVLDEANALRAQDFSVLPLESSFWVDTPIWIAPQPTIDFKAFKRKGTSFAQFSYYTANLHRAVGLEFWYLLYNDEYVPVRVNASGTVGFNGELFAHAQGDFFHGHHATCGVASKMRIFPWPQGTPEPPQVSTQVNQLEICEANNWDTYFADVDSHTFMNARVGLVSYAGLVIPARSSVVFAMVAQVTNDCSGGSARADFDSSDHYGVTCTGVMIEKLRVGGGGSPVVAPD